MTLHEGSDTSRREWLQAIVLWRAQSATGSGYRSADAIDLRRQSDAAHSSSRELGRQHLGGVYGNGYYYAEFDRERLWVLDQEFVLPRRDSALVVMVDGIDLPTGPKVFGYAYISARMPDTYWSKTWTSGDTTFMVHSRNSEGLLAPALRASPIVRAFLDEGAPK